MAVNKDRARQYYGQQLARELGVQLPASMSTIKDAVRIRQRELNSSVHTNPNRNAVDEFGRITDLLSLASGKRSETNLERIKREEASQRHRPAPEPTRQASTRKDTPKPQRDGLLRRVMEGLMPSEDGWR